jgi:ankyrin repeat protein
VAQAKQDGTTALMCAIQFDRLDCVRALLEVDAPVAQAKQDGTTALMLAIQFDRLDCVRHRCSRPSRTAPLR